MNMPMDVYNLASPEWFSFPGINRFRHVSWHGGKYLYTHGGFEYTQPNLPINSLTQVDLSETFSTHPDLLKNLEDTNTNPKQGLYQIDNMIKIGQYDFQKNQIQTHMI